VRQYFRELGPALPLFHLQKRGCHGGGRVIRNGNESAARVAFPSVPRGVDKLDADDIDAVVYLIDHVADLLRDLVKAIRSRGDDPDLLQRGTAEDRGPFSVFPFVTG
jgi:hypothetical protein